MQRGPCSSVARPLLPAKMQGGNHDLGQFSADKEVSDYDRCEDELRAV
jgi:hypothetical protein